VLEFGLRYEPELYRESSDSFWLNFPLFLFAGPSNWFISDNIYHADVELTVIDPGLQRTKLDLRHAAPGRYLGDIATPESGAYHLEILLKQNGQVVYRQSRGLAVGYSDDVFASGSPGVFYALGTGVDTPGDLSLDVEVGHYDLSRPYGESYIYAEMSLSGSVDPVDWRLSYFTAGDAAAKLFTPSTVADRLVLELSVAF